MRDGVGGWVGAAGDRHPCAGRAAGARAAGGRGGRLSRREHGGGAADRRGMEAGNGGKEAETKTNRATPAAAASCSGAAAG